MVFVSSISSSEIASTENYRKSYRNPREIIPLSRCSSVAHPLLKRFGMAELRLNVERTSNKGDYLGKITSCSGLD